MCGYFAAFTSSEFPLEYAKSILNKLSRRGPDFEGLHVSPGISMGHRRLSILDLDNRSSQPMISNCGRYTIVFNGEIYNFSELRDNLQDVGYNFLTNSDTEVILNLYIEYGENCLIKLKGMFTFIIWDSENKSAFVARDPYGIKPLYYAFLSDGIVFSSQIKALLSIDSLSKDLDLFSRVFYWMLGSIPEPRTWFKNIKMVPSGSFLIIENSKIIQSKIWFDIGIVWEKAVNLIDNYKSIDIFENVRNALLESVSRHMISDVPIAVFLSGGVDSGAIISLMREIDPKREIIGVTIVYDEFIDTPDDESESAKLIASLYDVNHHIVKVTEQDFISDLPQILDAMDQPSIDGINTWYASKAVADLGLKVVISGVGGDELFLGYPSFKLLPRLMYLNRIIKKFPLLSLIFQKLFNHIAFKTKNNRWRYFFEWLDNINGAWWLRRSVLTPYEAFNLMNMQNFAKDFSVDKVIEEMVGVKIKNNVLRLSQIESKMYLRNQLLRDADWASMYHGVELRTPLVDSYLLSSLKPYIKHFPKYNNKVLLGRAARNPLPNEIIFKKKTGFGIPVNNWINRFYNNKKNDNNLLMKHIEKYCFNKLL
jgi:asparagine synthase (glutamine-hydrolysing)